MPATIRVLVVDDSALIRQILTRALSVDPGIEIVGVARNGVEAIEQAKALSPDVITMDIEMPELTGLEALPHVAKHSSARVVMLSSLDDPDTTYSALRMGAVDFITKPRAGFASSITELSELLIKTIKTAYRVDPERVIRVREEVDAEDSGADDESGEPDRRSDEDALDQDTGLPARLVAIASSTGGPPALERVFSGLSRKLDAAYLIVQHLPAGFSKSLSRRLTMSGSVHVVEAQDGMPIRTGIGYLAPYGAHMTIIRAGRVPRIHLENSAPMHGVRPAADRLFTTVAGEFGRASVGVVLTGMGADGAKGLMEIKAVGGETIAQNEETSVVWGMPGAAARLGAVRHTVPIGLVAAEIRRVLRGEGAK